MTKLPFLLIAAFFLFTACHSGEKKTNAPADTTLDTAYVRERLTDPTPKDSVTEFGSSEGDAAKEPGNKND